MRPEAFARDHMELKDSLLVVAETRKFRGKVAVTNQTIGWIGI